MSDNWQDIETSPRDGTEFLCRWQPLQGTPQTVIARWNNDPPWVGLYGVNCKELGGQGNISWLEGGFPERRVLATHWMPLPEPPK